MITIYDAITFPVLGACILLAAIVLVVVVRIGYFKSILDPSVLVMYQIAFTFFALTAVGLMDAEILLCYFMLVVAMVGARNVTITKETIFTEKDWMLCATVMVIISLVSNAILISTKGFILLDPDPISAKENFYRNAGIFKRINDVSTPLLGVVAIHHLHRGKKVKGLLLLLYTVFLLLSSGSKSGVISIALYIGAYMHFHSIEVPKKIFVSLFVVATVSVMAMFYWTYREQAVDSLYRRTVAFADGPFYFFKGNMQDKIAYPIHYPLDQLLTNLRVQSELRHLSAGATINKHYFGAFNPLEGPNPQFIVEAQMIFGVLFFLYPLIVGVLFSVLRNSVSTPFAFALLSMFFTPLLLDSQYAFSNLLTLAILLPILLLLKYVRAILRNHTKQITNG